MVNKFNTEFQKGNQVTVPDWYDDMVAEGEVTAISYTGNHFTVKFVNGEDAGREFVFDENEIRPIAAESTSGDTHDWRNDPVSHKQLAYLAKLGVETYPVDNLTKGRASELIDAAKRNELGSVGGWYVDGSN